MGMAELVVRAVAARHGDPASVLSDNGAVFTGRFRRGRVALEITLHCRGVVFIHSRPYHPQTCGKVGRVHQTVKKHLATRPRARTLAQLQRQLDAFRDYTTPCARTGPCNARPLTGPTGPDPKPPAPASH